MVTEFRRLLRASWISNIGDGVAWTAVPLLAATLTRDERLIAGVEAAAVLPWLLVSLHVGALVDRFDRRRILVAADAFRTCAFALIAMLAATDALPACVSLLAITYAAVPLVHHPLVAATAFFLVGLASVVWNVVTVSLRQEIIPTGLFGRVNSVYRLVSWGVMPIGALLGGFVAHRFGLDSVWWIAALGHVAILAGALALLTNRALTDARGRATARADISDVP